MEPFLAQILLLAFNFAPKGWAFCAGQTLAINQNQAIFSLLGTTYGGNGTTTFLLPDLRGRTPIHPGAGPGLPQYTLGQVGGTETVTLIANQLPLHTHSMLANTGASTTGLPTGAILATGPVVATVPAITNLNVYSGSTNTTMGANALAASGGNQPFSILQPFSVLNYSIALQGIFPSRN